MKILKIIGFIIVRVDLPGFGLTGTNPKGD